MLVEKYFVINGLRAQKVQADMVALNNASGVDYNRLDRFKRKGQERAKKTFGNAEHLRVWPVPWTWGESVQVMVCSGASNFPMYRAHVNEGLGTKNLVADAMRRFTGKTYYDHIAKCAAAMILNDMPTLGMFPTDISIHLAVGNSKWFDDEERSLAFIDGFGRACDEAGVVWAGGETPELRGIICESAALISGSASGISIGDTIINPDSIRAGDAIIGLTSSGIHSNGLTKAREIAAGLEDGYHTTLSDGRMFGEALLDPTHIYCRFVEECVSRRIPIHYGVHVTGHGWRKLMRAPQVFAYRITRPPAFCHPVFGFIQEHSGMTNEAMYGSYNMGMGFALIVPPSSVAKILNLAPPNLPNYPFSAFYAGRVEESDTKRVIIESVDVTFEAEALQVR